MNDVSSVGKWVASCIQSRNMRNDCPTGTINCPEDEIKGQTSKVSAKGGLVLPSDW